MTIRKYEDSDFHQLASIHDSARMNELISAGLEDAFIPFIIASKEEDIFYYDIFVAQHNNIVVGFIAFNDHELGWLYVDVNHRGHGIGKSLINFALRNSSSEIEIEVLKENKAAVSLYNSFGFEVIHTLRGKMPGNESFEVNVHQMKRPQVTNLRCKQESLDKYAKWFSAQWNLPVEDYLYSMKSSINQKIPQWYILENKDGDIIARAGIIENDFHNRKDLTPNLCALYVEEAYRNKSIAKYLMDCIQLDLKSKDINQLYLISEHTNYYEKYGWSFLCNVQDEQQNQMRLYQIEF